MFLKHVLNFTSAESTVALAFEHKVSAIEARVEADVIFRG